MTGKPHLFVVALAASLTQAACTTNTMPLAPSGAGIISNTEWVLVQLDGEAIRSDGGEAAPTLTFSADDRSAGGFAGCNRFSTRYETDAGNLAFSPIAMTRMFCAGRMDLERRYVAALETTRTYHAGASTLDLAGPQGIVARFSRR